MRNYIPIVKIEERDPKWAAQVRERAKNKRRRQRDLPSNRVKFMFQGVKDEAKRKGVRFDLTMEWFETRLAAGV